MKLKIGQWVDKANGGVVHDRYLVMGRVIKDAEMRTVGAKGTSMLSFSLSPGREEDLVRIKMWGYDALDYNGLRKGTMMLLDCYEDSREYQGKTYTDYIPLNVMDVSEKPGRGAGTGKRAQKEVEPQDPMAGFVDFTNHDDLPF
jgi:hypothetical protein